MKPISKEVELCQTFVRHIEETFENIKNLPTRSFIRKIDYDARFSTLSFTDSGGMVIHDDANKRILQFDRYSVLVYYPERGRAACYDTRFDKPYIRICKAPYLNSPVLTSLDLVFSNKLVDFDMGSYFKTLLYTKFKIKKLIKIGYHTVLEHNIAEEAIERNRVIGTFYD